jgi:HTH-type transcriptional regulator/antitoxin HigA
MNAAPEQRTGEMATRTKKQKAPDVYLKLVRRFPLRPIRSDEELDRAVAMVDSLIDRENLNQDEQDYLDVLSDLVERYETEVHPIAPVSDAVLLTHLIEMKGVTQAEVAAQTGIGESTISAFVSGARIPNRKHIAKLAPYFHINPGVFAFQP